MFYYLQVLKSTERNKHENVKIWQLIPCNGSHKEMIRFSGHIRSQKWLLAC